MNVTPDRKAALQAGLSALLRAGSSVPQAETSPRPVQQPRYQGPTSWEIPQPRRGLQKNKVTYDPRRKGTKGLLVAKKAKVCGCFELLIKSLHFLFFLSF